MVAASSARWLLLSLAVLVADRASKYAVERFTAPGYRRELIPGFADLVHSINPGIAFGLLAGAASGWTAAALMIGSSAVVLLLVWLLLTGRAGAGTATPAGMALIAGGATGNLVDRLLHGGVTDFLELRAGRFVWPAFNAADAAITIGAVLIALTLFRGDARAAGERA